MDKNLYSSLGLAGLACLACCAAPLLSIAGFGATLVAFWKGLNPLWFLGGMAIFFVALVLLKRNTAQTYAINCSCKPKNNLQKEIP